MAAANEYAQLTPQQVERAVEIFTPHLSDACERCQEENLNDMALVSALFAGLVEVAHRTLGGETIGVLRRMLDDMDGDGSPLRAGNGAGLTPPGRKLS